MGKAWWWSHKAAGHTAFVVGKQREMNPAPPLAPFPFHSVSNSSPWMVLPTLRWIFPPPQHLQKQLGRHTKGSVSFMIPMPVDCRDVTVLSVESQVDSS